MADLWNDLPKRKIFILGAMMLCFIMTVAILQNISDTLIVSSAGPEAISFLRVTFLLPSIILSLMLLKNMASKRRKERNFYRFILGYVFFVMSFAFWIYPIQETLHLSQENVNLLTGEWPLFWVFWNILGAWTNAVFFLMTALWVSFIFSVVFWKIAGDVVVKKKTVLPVLGLIGALGFLLSGFMIQFVNKFAGSWEQVLIIMSVFFMAFCFILLSLYNRVGIVFQRHTIFQQNESKGGGSKKSTQKTSLKQDVLFLFKHKALLPMLIIFFTVGVFGNYLEVLWKSEVRLVYQTGKEYSAFMAQYNVLYGVLAFGVSAIAMLWFPKKKWSFNASLGPKFFILAASCFFLLYFAKYDLIPKIKHINVPDLFILWVGAFSWAVFMAGEFLIVQPLMKICYSKMNDSEAMKGRTLIEIMGKTSGKMIGACSLQLILAFSGALNKVALPLFIILLVLLVVRMKAIPRLGHALNMDQ